MTEGVESKEGATGPGLLQRTLGSPVVSQGTRTLGSASSLGSPVVSPGKQDKSLGRGVMGMASDSRVAMQRTPVGSRKGTDLEAWTTPQSNVSERWLGRHVS